MTAAPDPTQRDTDGQARTTNNRSLSDKIRTRTRWLIGLCLLATVFLLLNLAQMPFGRDQAIFAMVANAFFEGGQPYRDAWDFKTPGIFFTYATARLFFGPGEAGFRVFEILWWLGMGGAFVFIGRGRIDIGASMLAFLLAVYGMTVEGFWHVGQPESFGAGLLTGALALYLAPDLRRRARFAAWAAGAALYTAAAMLKPPLGGGILVSAGIVGVTVWQTEGVTALWRPILAHLIGGVSVLIAVAAWLIVSGTWSAFQEALFVFAPNYASLGHASTSFSELLGRAARILMLDWPWLPVGLGLLAAFGYGNRRLIGPTLHILGVVGVLLVGVALQAKFFPYHYAAAVALTSLPAAWGYWLLWQRIAKWRFGLLAMLTGLATLALLAPNGILSLKHDALRSYALWVPSKRTEITDKLYLAGMDWASDRRAALWLAENAPTAGDPTLFIWGFEPNVYFYSGLRPHNRYIYNVAMRAPWSADAARAEFLTRYTEKPPWAILVQSNDGLPWVTGSSDSSREVLDTGGFPELQTILKRDYRLQETVGPLDIYIRDATG